jgi:ribosomal protein S19
LHVIKRIKTMKNKAYIAMDEEGYYIAVHNGKKYGYTVKCIAEMIVNEINTGTRNKCLGVDYTGLHKK